MEHVSVHIHHRGTRTPGSPATDSATTQLCKTRVAQTGEWSLLAASPGSPSLRANNLCIYFSHMHVEMGA